MKSSTFLPLVAAAAGLASAAPVEPAGAVAKESYSIQYLYLEETSRHEFPREAEKMRFVIVTDKNYHTLCEAEKVSVSDKISKDAIPCKDPQFGFSLHRPINEGNAFALRIVHKTDSGAEVSGQSDIPISCFDSFHKKGKEDSNRQDCQIGEPFTIHADN